MGSTDQHSADRDGPHDKVPNRACHTSPVVWRVCGKIVLELRSHEKYEQWDDQPPSQYTASKLNGCEPESDDIANSEVRGAHARRGECGRASGGQDVGICGRPQPDLAVAQISYSEVNVLGGSEQPKTSQYINQTADADVPEKILR